MNKKLKFKGLLTINGWLENAVVEIDENGKLVSISQDSSDVAENIDGYALPGFQNAHSHAFQYAMAGLAELHEGTGTPDDFWSWRNAMYNLALTVSPQHLEDIASMLYAEMARHGYTAVAEFHYLHHDVNGKPYANLAEHGERLIAAANKAGIHITLVPMFYQQGGFGLAAESKQRRFISETIEDYYRLLESTVEATKQYQNANYGMGIHSLRAVKEEDILSVCNDFKNHIPFHIHISEQKKEVEDCLKFYGKRPVEWLLNNCQVTENFHLVHATHLNEDEVKGIAKSKANVVLCPSTEGNLGDGLFAFEQFKNENGNWSIGTDSHVGLNPFEELRILDYGQRLTTHKRNTFYQPLKGDSGFNAIEMAWKTGKKAMGENRNDFFEIGQSFDAVVMDAKAPLLTSTSTKNLCNTFVYSSDASHILGAMVQGNWVSQNGRHENYDSIYENFQKTMKDLRCRL
ncbi:formimidoylglutamate deiminase [Flagellimonas sp. GZD32]|uniref:formimidoylglutamate deiminase n=1 Tax=Flagellimonas cixiensis TaxID=3228750 RepID=UPI0035C8A697